METAARFLLSHPTSVPSLVPKAAETLGQGRGRPQLVGCCLEMAPSPRELQGEPGVTAPVRTHPGNEIVLIHSQQQSL